MATIENFILRFKVEGQQAVDGIKNSIGGLRDDLADFANIGGPFSNTIGGITGKLGSLGTAALGASIAFGALGLKAATVADEINDLADATGIGAGQLLNLRSSLAKAGGDGQSFATVASRITQAIGESMSGNEKYQQSFRDLGIAIRDSNGVLRDSGTILEETIQALAGIEDPALRQARALELLGKEALKIDWSNVKAPKDAFGDEQVKQLAKYRGAIDDLYVSIEEKLVRGFGSLAIAIQKIEWTKETAKVLDYLKAVSPLARMGGIALESGLMREQAQRESQAELLRESRRGTPAAPRPVAGDQGPQSEEKRKAAAEKAAKEKERLEKEAADLSLRIFRSEQNAKRDILLQFTSDEEEIANIRANSQIAEARKTIENAKELSAKIAEIEAARDLEIAKFRTREQERAAAEQKRLAEKLADETRRLNETAGTQIAQYGAETKLLENKIALQQEIINLTTLEAERRTKVFEADRDRTRLLALTTNLPPDQRLLREQAINEEYNKRIALINQEADTRARRENDFAAGIRTSMRRYEESLTPLKRGQQMADSVFQNMDGALRNFVDNGKFNFRDFANSVIRDLILIELRASTVSLFKSVFGSMGTALGFRAGGGPVSAGQPYVVGERGAELFVPSTGGTILSNGQLRGGGSSMGVGSSNVVYNINAVDASSFKQLVARDPGFIYAVTEQGRKAVPSTRR